MTLRESGHLLREAASAWSTDNASRLGAALAYYTVFSLAPLLVLVLVLVSVVWAGQSAALQEQVLGQMQALLGPDGAALVRTMLESARSTDGGSVLATVISVVLLLVGATTVFVQLQGALNTIWNVRPDPDRGLKSLITTRLLSFGAVLVIGFLLLVSLVLSAVLAFMGEILTSVTPGAEVLMRLVNFVVSLGVITLLFTFIYRYLPDVEIDWHDVWIGAALTAVLFTLGKWALSLYLGLSSTASTFGAAGSLVVLLIWVYYSAQIFFFGAELTKVYARRRGTQIRPSEHAIWAGAPDETPAR